jgi:hypothetical protein
LARPQHREENNASQLGQTLSAQGARRLGITGSLHNEQGSKHQNLVAVVKKPQGSLGQTLEAEIHSKCGREEPNSLEWGQPGLLNLDNDQAEQTAGDSARLLGNHKWRDCSFLERLLATMASSGN